MRTAYAPPGDAPSTWTGTTVRVRERPTTQAGAGSQPRLSLHFSEPRIGSVGLDGETQLAEESPETPKPANRLRSPRASTGVASHTMSPSSSRTGAALSTS
jgi:hypothetical protein